MMRIIKGLEADQSMEQIESIMGEEPVLAYRFLSHVNSAGIGLRTGIASIRHGLMMMGYSSLAKWLVAQLPKASNDINMHPVKAAMVLRARLMEHLLDAGIEEDLRREVYLCGLFSQLNLLMADALPNLLRRLPLSDRIYDATVTHTGPYAAALAIATSQAQDDTATIRAVCAQHSMPIDEANRALLRTLITLKVQPVAK
jgi:c-di-GMP-related signal transduction protein